jgi:hypothetical protein
VKQTCKIKQKRKGKVRYFVESKKITRIIIIILLFTLIFLKLSFLTEGSFCAKTIYEDDGIIYEKYTKNNIDDKINNKIIIEAVEDSTNIEELSYLEKDNKSSQILKLNFIKGSKWKILKAIEELEKLEMVLVAKPNYLLGIEFDEHMGFNNSTPNDFLFNK